MKAFIDEHRDAYGVEPICKVLPIAPSTYRAHAALCADPSRISARAQRDAAMRCEISRVWEENFQVYGVRKVWCQLLREGFGIARCTVARLMGEMGLAGVVRGKPVRTTVSDSSTPCPEDRVNRQFRAPTTECLVGFRLYLRRHVGGFRLCGLRHRRLRQADRRLAGLSHSAGQLRSRRLGTGA
jgi:transposase InsO family protein